MPMPSLIGLPLRVVTRLSGVAITSYSLTQSLEPGWAPCMWVALSRCEADRYPQPFTGVEREAVVTSFSCPVGFQYIDMCESPYITQNLLDPCGCFQRCTCGISWAVVQHSGLNAQEADAGRFSLWSWVNLHYHYQMAHQI
jgi:hypothetical protein